MSRAARLVVLTVLACAAVPSAQGARSALPFIEDDYPRALAEARSRRLPVFIEAWAPW